MKYPLNNYENPLNNYENPLNNGASCNYQN